MNDYISIEDRRSIRQKRGLRLDAPGNMSAVEDWISIIKNNELRFLKRLVDKEISDRKEASE